MTAKLVYINGLELGASNAQYLVGTPSWLFSEAYGTVIMNSAVRTHQPIGQVAPFAGSVSLQLRSENAQAYGGPDVAAYVSPLGDAGNSARGGRLVFSHYHDAGVWAGGGSYYASDRRLVRVLYSPGGNTEACSVQWNSNGTLSLYVRGQWKETTTAIVPDATWVRIGLVWTGDNIGSHANVGARLYINGAAATSWYGPVWDNYSQNDDSVQIGFFGSHGHGTGSDPWGSTFVDHIVVTGDDSIDINDGTTTSTGAYIDTESWQVIVPAVRPDSDIPAFTSGTDFVPSTGSDNFGVIDEALPSSADYTESSADPSSFGCGYTALAGGLSGAVVKGVQMTFMGQGDGTMATADTQIASDGATLSAAKAHTVAAASSIYTHTVEQDPGTGGGATDWTAATVNSAGFKYTTT